MTSSIRAEYSDEEIRRRISTFLSSRHFSVFRNLNVEVDQGIVHVSGELDSFYSKQVALNSVQRVAGVMDLVDEIVVDDVAMEGSELQGASVVSGLSSIGHVSSN